MKCIVKVGRTTTVKLRNCDVDRAVTMKELKRKIQESSYDYIIVESVSDKDFGKLKEMVADTGVKRESIVIYNPECSCESEGLTIVKGIEKLQVYMSESSGVDVKTYDMDYPADWREEAVEEAIETVGEEDNSIGVAEEEYSGIEETEDEPIEEVSEVEEAPRRVIGFQPAVDTAIKKADEVEKYIQSIGDVDDKQETEEEEDGVPTGITKEQEEYFLGQIHSLTERLRYWQTKAENTSFEMEKLRDKLDKLIVTEEVAEFMSSTADERELAEQVKALSDFKDRYETLLPQIEELKEKAEKAEQEALELRTTNRGLEETIEDEVDARLSLSKVISEVAYDAYKLKRDIEAKEGTIERIRSGHADIQEEVDRLQEEINTRDRLIEEMTVQQAEVVAELKNENASLMSQLEENAEKVMEYSSQVGELKEEVARITREAEELQEKIVVKEEEVVAQNNQIARFNAMNVDEMQVDIAALQESNQMLQTEVGKLVREKENFEHLYSEAQLEIRNLKEYGDKLGITARSLARTNEIGDTVEIECKYFGKAMIIPVFGSGSYGVTSLTFSIAQLLPGRVLVVDFDLVSPKMDNWFGVNPINADLPGIPNMMHRTGFGALIDKDTEYVIQNRKGIIKQNKTKTARTDKHPVDYFSGAYSGSNNTQTSDDIDAYKLMAVDFTQFFSYFGNEYDYIIIDCGRLGGSNMEEALIKMLNKISFRNIAISLHNAGDCRTMFMRMGRMRIDGHKTMWITNMASSNGLTSDMKKCLKFTAEHYCLRLEPKIFGDAVDLNRTSLSRDMRKIVDRLTEMWDY